MTLEKPYAPSCDRNRNPILAVLREHFAACRHVLEIGSGTGQHAVYFAAALPHLTWQTSETIDNLHGLQMWLDDAQLRNTPKPLRLDVNGDWPQQKFDAVFSANTLHIMSWPEVEKLFERLQAVLEPDSVVAIYGPFNYGGKHTSESNARFDAMLRERDPRSGLRDIEALIALGEREYLEKDEDLAMPANNRLLIFKKESSHA